MTSQTIQYHLDMGSDEELLQYAKEEVGEDEEIRRQSLEKLKKLIAESEDGGTFRTDDAFLLRFLRTRFFVMKYAYSAVRHYYKFKRSHPEYYDKVSFNRIAHISKLNLIHIQPFLDQTGRRVMICRLAPWDPDEVTSEELFRSALFLLELSCLEPRNQILGGICILDVGGVTIKQAKHLTPRIISQCMEISMRSYPIRAHAIHLVNESSLMKPAFLLVKHFLDPYIRDRIFFHRKNMSTLHQHIKPKYLPQRYGGIHPDYNCDEWIEHVKTNEAVRKEICSLGYNIN